MDPLSFSRNQPPDKTAVITEDEGSLTYGEINAFSESIKKLIPDRCMVFCLCRNTIGSLCGYLAFVDNEIVPVMLDAGIDSQFLAGLIRSYKPRYLWIPGSRVSEFPEGQPIFSADQYTLVKLEKYKPFPVHKDLALLLATSGSTGGSKYVRISHENIRANAGSIAEYLGINENERPITTLPMCYSYGLSVINSHLLKGATLLLTARSFMGKAFWTFLKEQKASSMAGVPWSYQILDKLHFERMDLPSLKTLTQAGGRLNPELDLKISRYCQQSGRQFFVMYGQTEATARMSCRPPEDAMNKPGSIGIPIPGGTFSLVDEQGKEISGADQEGELVYRGKNVSMGYASGWKDLDKGDENHGILFTGDLAKRDEDGCYYIVGRKSRFIKIFGNRVSLDETETLLEQLTECACTGEDDRMIIYITDKERKAEVEQLMARTGIHPAGFTVRHCARIPKNPAGKTLYTELDIR